MDDINKKLELMFGTIETLDPDLYKALNTKIQILNADGTIIEEGLAGDGMKWHLPSMEGWITNDKDYPAKYGAFLENGDFRFVFHDGTKEDFYHYCLAYQAVVAKIQRDRFLQKVTQSDLRQIRRELICGQCGRYHGEIYFVQYFGYLTTIFVSTKDDLCSGCLRKNKK